MQFHHNQVSLDISIDQLIIAGWTGRDAAAVQHHIDELAAIGIAPPSAVPLFYRGARSLVTQDPVIQVLGQDTSGEVEPLLIQAAGTLWIGIGSDHTDRKLEAHSVAASKQACAKPVGAELWAFAEVADHLDSLILSCEIFENNAWVSYQQGALTAIRPLGDLIQSAGMADGTAMLCGTLPAKGGVRAAPAYRMTLHDPQRNRSLQLSYKVAPLPILT